MKWFLTYYWLCIMAQLLNQPAQYFSRIVSGFIPVFFAFLMFSAPSWAITEEEDVESWLTQATETVKDQERYLKQARTGNIKISQLSEQLDVILPIKSRAQTCIESTEAQLTGTNEDLATLGESTDKESKEVTKKRRSLTNEQKNLDKLLSSCKLVLLQSQDLIESVNELQQSTLAQQLSARTSHIFTVISNNLKAPEAGWQNSIDFLRAQYQLKLLNTNQTALLIICLAFGLVGGVHYSRGLRKTALQSAAPTDSVSAFTLALRSSLAPALPVLLPVAIAAAFLSYVLPVSPLPFITKVSYMLGIYLALIVLINVLLSPAPPATVYLTRPDKLSRRLAKHLKILLSIGFVGFFVLSGEFKASLSEPVYYLARSVFSILFIINLTIILWMLRLFSWAVLSRTPRIGLSLILISCLIADLAGYRNLSFFVLGGVIATSISLALTMLVYRLLVDLWDGLDEGRLEWEKKLRKRVGLKKGELVPGLVLIRIIFFTSLWTSFAISALHIWKLDDPWVSIISEYLTQGFTIGSLSVTPTLILGGILTFALILHLTRYIKNHLLPSGLKHTKLDRGAREAVTSLVGYAGVAIALLIALSISGVEMQNIALIAGALSVGIGFGLQNIVNNFISGLILLFERPIRRGDWIVTGDTEGYVKAINIRSTQIETFDKADVIVPNSELITAKVTNWMLRDNFGRITISIGVGYDSDVNKVHKILIDIANEHPLVVRNNRNVADPKVLFRNFGDSSLNFELRCFIQDIDQRLNVISQINFAIIKAFRSEGIEIPFPQRVVTVANLQDLHE